MFGKLWNRKYGLDDQGNKVMRIRLAVLGVKHFWIDCHLSDTTVMNRQKSLISKDKLLQLFNIGLEKKPLPFAEFEAATKKHSMTWNTPPYFYVYLNKGHNLCQPKDSLCVDNSKSKNHYQTNTYVINPIGLFFL